MLLILGNKVIIYELIKMHHLFVTVQAVDWDYWMGTDLVRRGREVVIPEVSRTAHLGLAGAHVQGQAKKAFLNRALSNHTDVHLNVTM